MNLPSHQNPTKDRTASAPYNFLPLPEFVVPAVKEPDKELPDQDRFHDKLHTGYFEVTLTTKSPLYVRAMLSREEYERQNDKAEEQKPFRERVKNKPGFFSTQINDEPVIPGSSLRGMLRNLLEAVSYGKMEWVTEKQLFFRSLDISTIGDHYRARMSGNVQAGFLRREGSRYFIKKCDCVRIFRSDLDGRIYDVHGSWHTPRWKAKKGEPRQHLPIWVQTNESNTLVKEHSFKKEAEWPEGRLVITGDMRVKKQEKSKKKEFVFLLPKEESDELKTDEITIPDEMLERFHDDDQITQWQQKAFPFDEPKKNCRERDGFLMRNPGLPGDPVFFLREEGKLTFFGRAQMFRLPYKKSPLDFVPDKYKNPETLDYAEAIFGYMKGSEVKAAQGEKTRAYASRVFVTDAKLSKGQSDIWLSNENDGIVPRILASPKPTAFQHYLVQTRPDKILVGYTKEGRPKYELPLSHYGSTDTVIRGRKFYWHQGRKKETTNEDWRAFISEKDETLREIAEKEAKENYDTQHTQFQPVKPDTKFTFRVYFENLSEVELGAMCWVLQPLPHPDLSKQGKEICHHLGMGKPLGMGSVKLDAKLIFTDRESRYKTLFNGNDWETGVRKTDGKVAMESVDDYRTKFEQEVLTKLQLYPKYGHLYDLKRIAMLLKLMEWPGFPAVLEPKRDNRFLRDLKRPNTRYMTIALPGVEKKDANEYKERPVLPDPEAFGGLHGAQAAPAIDKKDQSDSSGSPSPKSLQPKPAQQKSSKPKTSQPPSQQPPEMSREARALLKSVEKQHQLAEVASQNAYANGDVEKKATVIKNPDGTLSVVLPRLKDKAFPLEPKRQFSKANTDAKIRARVVVDKNNAIIRVEEL